MRIFLDDVLKIRQILQAVRDHQGNFHFLGNQLFRHLHEKCDLKELVNELKKEFEMTIGSPSYYLGIQTETLKDESSFIHQEKYAKELLKRFRMEEANPTLIPIEPGQDINGNSEEETVKCPYREDI